MIKNFVVKVKQIHYESKGLKNFLKYLEDEKRHPDGIIKIKGFSKENFFKNTVLNITEYNINKKSGRKSKNFADSFIFTIPPLYEEKGKEKLKKILNNLVEDIYKQFNDQLEEKITKGNFLKQIYINIHIDKEHIHFNVVFPRVIKVGNKLISNRITNRKKFLHKIKQYWTHNLVKNLNVSIEDYKPSTGYKKGYKKSFLKEDLEKINEIKKENEGILKEIEEKKKEIKNLDEFLKLKRSEIKTELEELLNENKRREEIVKALGLAIRYYKNFVNNIQKKDMRKILKNYKNFKEKIKILKEIEIKNNNIKEIVSEMERKSEEYAHSLSI